MGSNILKAVTFYFLGINYTTNMAKHNSVAFLLVKQKAKVNGPQLVLLERACHLLEASRKKQSHATDEYYIQNTLMIGNLIQTGF